MLVLTSVVPCDALDVHAPGTAAALSVEAGDNPDRCRRLRRRRVYPHAEVTHVSVP